MYSFVEQQTTQQTTTNCNGCQHVERAELIVPACETESEIQEIQVQVPSRVPMRHRQVIRVPGPAGKVKQVVKRLPTPQPDIIEKLTVLQPQQDVINVITERPFTPPPQIVERRIIEKPLKPIINYFERRVASNGCGIKTVEASTVEIPLQNLAPISQLTQAVNIGPAQVQLAPTQQVQLAPASIQLAPGSVHLAPTQVQYAPAQVQLATAQLPLTTGQVTITQTRPIGSALSPAALSTAALSQAALSTAALSTAALPATFTNAPLRTQSIYSNAITQRITPTTLTPITYTYARPSVVGTPATFFASSPRSATTYVRRISDISPIYQTYQSSPVAELTNLASPTTFQTYSPTLFQGYSTPANTIFQAALPTTTYRQAAALPATTYQTAALPTFSYSPYQQSYIKYY